MFLDILYKKRKINPEVSDKVYTHKKVIDTLIGEIIKIDIGGVPDGSFYAPGLVLPDEKTGFAIYHRWENGEKISVDWPYEKKAGIKKSGYNGTHKFEPWALSSRWIDSRLVVGGDCLDGYEFKPNPEYLSLDNMLDSYGLTIDLHYQKIKEFN